MKKILLFCGLLLFFTINSCLATINPPAVDQAFPLSVNSPDERTIIVHWEIQPGYYLYQNRIHIKTNVDGAAKLDAPQFPQGTKHDVPGFGSFVVYDSPVDILVPVVSHTKNVVPLEVSYQGCSKEGFCYPPQVRLVTTTLSASPSQDLGIDHIPGHAANSLLKKHIHWTAWIGFFGLGLLISLTPCVLPMIPVLSSLILGKQQISHLRAFFISLAYVLGMAITYAIAGMIFGAIGSTLQAWLQKPVVIGAFTGIIIAMALSLFGLYHLSLPQSLRSKIVGISNRQRHGSIIGATFMGALSSLILSPCATPPLVAVLSYISQSGNPYLGGIALFLIGLGSGVPLLLIGLFGKRLLPHTGPWMRHVENILGIALLGVAIWMLSRILSPVNSLILWSVWGIGIAIFLKAFSTPTRKVQYLTKSLGILIFIYSILLLASIFTGNTNPLMPFSTVKNQQRNVSLKFITVKTSDDIKQQMAKNLGKPVFLDFYAQWCITCKYLEARVLTNPAVQNQLQRFLLLRADITADDDADRALMKQYGIIAPPTYVVFNSQHTEVPLASSVGEVSVKQLSQKLAAVQ